MFFPDRPRVLLDIACADELAALLTGQPQCLDAAFRVADTLFLNDSMTPDGPQVYGVVRHEQELDLIEFSACTRDEAFDYIRGILDTPTVEYPGAPHPLVVLNLSCPAVAA